MAVVLVLAVALAVCLWGGFTQHWHWTGVGRHQTLWHWMNLLAVPIAFATLPLVLRSHGRMRTVRGWMLLCNISTIGLKDLKGHPPRHAWRTTPVSTQ